MPASGRAGTAVAPAPADSSDQLLSPLAGSLFLIVPVASSLVMESVWDAFIAQPGIADLDLHGLAVVVLRVVDDSDEGLVHPFTGLHPLPDFRALAVVRSFRGGAARDGLEVVTHVVVVLP